MTIRCLKRFLQAAVIGCIIFHGEVCYALLTRHQLLEYVSMVEKLIKSDSSVVSIDTTIGLHKKLRVAYGELGDKKKELETIAKLIEEYDSQIVANPQYRLFGYAEFLSKEGNGLTIEPGRREFIPDYVKALELYRRLIQEYQEPRDQIQKAIDEVAAITNPKLLLWSSTGNNKGVVVAIRNIAKLRVVSEDGCGNLVPSSTMDIIDDDHRMHLVYVPGYWPYASLSEKCAEAAILHLEANTGEKVICHLPAQYYEPNQPLMLNEFFGAGSWRSFEPADGKLLQAIY